VASGVDVGSDDWAMTRIALGPIRQRRIVLGVGLPGMVALPAVMGSTFRPSLLAVAMVGAGCAARAARTRVELAGGELIVVNFLRTTRLPAASVERAGFGANRWDGSAVPLILVRPGGTVRASGVSVWSRRLRWPDQPFVRGRRSLARIEAFFADAGVPFDPREPVALRG
jgi:hypothetical protein